MALPYSLYFQTCLQGEKPTPHRVSPESFLERGLWDELRRVFLHLELGRLLRQLVQAPAYLGKNQVPCAGGEPIRVPRGEGGQTTAGPRLPDTPAGTVHPSRSQVMFPASVFCLPPGQGSHAQHGLAGPIFPSSSAPWPS